MAKPNERKHSVFVAEQFTKAFKPLSHLPKEKLDQAVAEFLDSRRSTPGHIDVIRRLGVLGALRGYTDEDIARYIEADELVKRETNSPADFVSQRTYSASQSVHGKLGGKKSDVSDDAIAAWLKNRGYERSDNKTEMVIEAMEQFDVKKTKVTDALRKAGMTRRKATKKA